MKYVKGPQMMRNGGLVEEYLPKMILFEVSELV